MSNANEMRKLMENVGDNEEEKFIAIMNWYRAASGMPAKGMAADVLKEKFPGIEPWTWRGGFSAYLKAGK